MPRKNKAALAAETPSPPAPIVAYKGFDQDFTCRGFRYEVGRTERHDGPVVACQSGFHACEHPLNVFKYYAPATSRFAEVELRGQTDRESGGDTKIAAAEITIKAELKLPQLIERAVRYVMDRVTWVEGPVTDRPGEAVRSNKDGDAATASGIEGAATASGDWGAATASGYGGAATASGIEGAATASGNRGAATASGTGGAATASGERGAATASGKNTIAVASGRGGKVRGVTGSDLVLREFDDTGNVIARWMGTVGQDGIKPMTWYTLRRGKPVEIV